MVYLQPFRRNSVLKCALDAESPRPAPEHSRPTAIGCLCEAYNRHPYFCSDADFDRKYLRNGLRYQQSENGIITHDSSRVRQKNLVNFGPLKAQP